MNQWALLKNIRNSDGLVQNLTIIIYLRVKIEFHESNFSTEFRIYSNNSLGHLIQLPHHSLIPEVIWKQFCPFTKNQRDWLLVLLEFHLLNMFQWLSWILKTICFRIYIKLLIYWIGKFMFYETKITLQIKKEHYIIKCVIS